MACFAVPAKAKDKDTRSSNAKAAADDIIYDGNLSFLSSRKSDSKKERQLTLLIKFGMQHWSRQGPTYKYCDVSISSIYFTLFLCCQNLLYFLRDKDTRSSNAKAAADDMIYDGNLSFLSSRKSDSKKERQLIRRRLQLMLYNIMYRMMFDAKFESQNDPLFIEATKFNEQSRLAQSFDYNYGDFILLLRPLLKGYLKKCRDLQSKRVAFFNSYYVEKRRKVMAENGQKRKLSCAIDHIIDAQIEGEISEENVRYIVENINVAAIETTLWSMEWAIAELANHPAIQCKIRDEISTVLNGQRVTESNLHQLPYLQATVKETLRLHTPIPLLVPHMNLEEAKLGGYTIPKESKVVVNAWWLANNPAWWKNPNEFRPERFMEEESSAEALAEKSTSGSCSLAWGGGAAPESFLHYQFSAW
ncbi:UNVERIFIED_CONTAM: Cytochrome [Sesamum indicum]